MRAHRLIAPAPAERSPLQLQQLPLPQAGPGQLLLKVRACGVCHTDLHLVEGDIRPPALPRTPGHQVVAEVAEVGPQVEGWAVGDRGGVAWLGHACGECDFCRRGEQNLCPQALFTGFHIDGGYAEYLVAEAAFTLRLPSELSDSTAAPLLCAGIIGFRSLRRADLSPGERLGLVGFGASAHLALQVARHWGCEVFVFSRSESHRRLARDLGAAWAGGAEDQPPGLLDRAILFAPAGSLVPIILAKLRPGGTLAINAIHMSPIPEMAYSLLYGERTLRSVANATHRDGLDFLQLAAAIPLQVSLRQYEFEQANLALADLKHSRINGAGVLCL
jgi:propanol-preferring alcohol dehydrogenase